MLSSVYLLAELEKQRLTQCNAMQCIGQKMKSRERVLFRRPVSGVRPASVDEILTSFVDRSSPNLEHIFPASYRSKVFCAVRSEVVCEHARPLMDCHLQVSNV